LLIVLHVFFLKSSALSKATISFADASDLELRIRFTDPTAPLFIDIEGDAFESLFVISTSQVQSSATESSKMRRESSIVPVKKRLREDTPGGETPRFKKPMKVVQQADRDSMARDTSMGPPRHSSPYLGAASQSGSQNDLPATPAPPLSSLPIGRNGELPLSNRQNQNAQEPLFLPSSSQLSIMDEDALKESGLGIEYMDPDEFNAMLEDEGEEVNHNSGDIDSDKIWSEMELESADADMRDVTMDEEHGHGRLDEVMALQPTQHNEGDETSKVSQLFLHPGSFE
jgi:cell cycle checkpoint control protein RAD9A